MTTSGKIQKYKLREIGIEALKLEASSAVYFFSRIERI